MSRLVLLDSECVEFPPIEQAMPSPDGLLAVGGDLRPQRLERAYYDGIFPWFEEGDPLLWWSPGTRMIMTPSQVHVSRSLRRLLRKAPFRISMDQAFPAIIRACAVQREDGGGTWITPAMQAAYTELHTRGRAHSVEVWLADELVGGLYGVSIGPLFFGESMFSRHDNASKVAFVALARQLAQWQFRMIDCQMPTAHLASLGARPVSRAEFKTQLWRWRDEPGRQGLWTFELGDDLQPLPNADK